MFSIDLGIRDTSGQAVITLCGELGLADIPACTSHLIAAVAACGPSLIVNLATLEHISNPGLQMLVRVLKWTRGSGGDLSLVAPQPQVRQVLETADLTGDFSVYPSVECAEKSALVASPRASAVLLHG